MLKHILVDSQQRNNDETINLKVDTISENTSANGVAVDGVTLKDGGIAATDGSTITTADNTDTLTLISTDADATVGPNLNFYRNSGSPADNDDLGKIVFNGRNDNSQDVVYAQIRSTIVDASDGTEDGLVKHDVSLGGTAYQHLSMGNGSIVFNEESQDIDFRVESNGNANMLFINGGTDRIGVGINDPVQALEVRGQIGISASGTGSKFLGFYSSDTLSSFIEKSGDNLTLYNVDAGDIRLATNDAEKMRIHSNGVISSVNGIALGVGTANTASNVLDDYEEGVTGNVSLTCGSSGSASLQTNFKKLAYTKVGRLVTITGLLKITSVSSPTGGLTFALPFALASLGDTAEICRGHGYIVNAANAENGDGGLLVDIQTEGGTSALIAKTDNTANGLRDLDSTFLTSQAEISLSFSYFTA